LLLAPQAAHAQVSWSLVWSDEFDTGDGQTPNAANWVMEQGWNNGWGNNELETYTNRTDNAVVNTADGGILIITAKQETYTNPFDGIEKDYTSARLKTAGLQEFTYGKIEGRIKIPTGQGIWPAFWMLGTGIDDNPAVAWPNCGEIDIMENVGHIPATVIGTLHGPGYSGGSGLSVSQTLSGGEEYTDAYHTFAIEWGENVVYWLIDGNPIGSKANWEAPGAWPFNNQDFFILLNVAVGGFWPGPPDGTTLFPQQMLVDYVRASENTGDPLPVPTVPTATPPGPFGGTPVVIPSTGTVRIEAENFDYGGEGVAYHDTDAGNNGATYRPLENVDIGQSFDNPNTPSIGWAGAGEWLHYAVDVAAAGTYTMKVRVANGSGDTATIHLEMDNVDFSGTISSPPTGGWGNWSTLTTVVNLPSPGVHVLRLEFDTFATNVNWIEFTAGGPTPTPTPGPYTTLNIPGKVEAEFFDIGGEGVAYHDNDVDNHGSVFRTEETVEIETTADTGGGHDIGWTGVGEWLEYTVNVTQTGSYTIQARVAVEGNGGDGGTFHLELGDGGGDDADITGPMLIPNTGGWQNWTTISVSGVNLTAGTYKLRLEEDIFGPDFRFGNFNWFNFVLETEPDYDSKAPDLHGDGLADILWRNSSTGLVYNWKMNGGTITGQGSIATLADANWKMVATGDFNGDGRSDLVWKNYSTGQVYIWMMNGLAYTPNLVATVDLGWDILGAGDTDGDGKADLIWRNGTTGSVYNWKMNGAAIGPTLPISTALADMQWGLVAVRDYNADGKSDLMWRHRGTGQVGVWLLNGATILASGATGTIDLNWSIVAGGDLTGDGKADIVWRHRTTGLVYLWTMNGVTTTAQGPITTVADSNWKIFASGRYNSDNKTDLLWRNTATGAVYVWIMNGATPVSFLPAGSVPDANWVVQNLK
jgi:beta-glucanase (GH16 family)